MMRFAAVVAKTERAIGARVERYRLRRSCGARLPSMEPTVHQVARRFRPLRPLLGVSPLVVWFTATCLAYYYKPLMCGGVADSLGAGGFCDASVRGISMNQWAEIVLYCPSMWLGLHLSKRDVFEGARVHRGERHSLQRQELAADLGIALLLYGYGLHVANVIEIHSRRDARITSGSVYDLTYFLDEDLSHYVIQLSLFFVLGWLIAYDRPDRVEGATVALLIGVAHGVERGVSFVESGKSFFVFPVLSWFVFAVVTRWRRRRSRLASVFEGLLLPLHVLVLRDASDHRRVVSRGVRFVHAAVTSVTTPGPRARVRHGRADGARKRGRGRRFVDAAPTVNSEPRRHRP